MTRSAIRRTPTILAALAFVSVLASSPASAQTVFMDDYGYSIWQSSSTQTLRLCINGVSLRPAGERRPTEEVAFYFTKIVNHVGDTVLEKELRVPSRGFQCADFPYAELVTVLGPAPATAAVSFRVDVTSRFSDSSDDGSTDASDLAIWQEQYRIVGAVMLVDTFSGKIETYEPLRAIRGIARP